MAFRRKGRPRLNELRDDKSNYLDKEFESEKRSTIYTTEKINKILEDINAGRKADMMPFFHGKTEWRNSNIIFEYTHEEWEEIQKCASEPLYFIEKYCAFKTDYGVKTVNLRDYQKDVIHMICDEEYIEERDLIVPKNRRVILLQSRQTGKTTTTAAAFCWYLCFHFDKNTMVVANKGNTAKEVLGKIRDIFKTLPFFLKPGVNSLADDRVSFENGCSLRCAATSDSPTTGDTLHMLLIDECALIPANKINDFWASVWPTMSSSILSQIVVLSTPRGKHNLYYDLYSGAINGKNGFVHKRVDYWQVPGHDTEEWKQDQISIFGEALFNQEFGLSFEEDATKLVAPKDLKFMNKIKKFYRSVEIYGVPYSISSKIYWHPDFHPDELSIDDLLNNRFLLQVDIAEGKQAGMKGQEDPDWNIINIYKIELLPSSRIKRNRLGYKAVYLKDCIRLRQVGVYMDQSMDDDICADAAKNIVFNIFKCGQVINETTDIDCCRILVEMNFNGKNWMKRFINHDMFYTALLLKTMHSQKAIAPDFGFKTVAGERGKGYWCEYGARLIAARQIIVSQDHETIPVMSTIQQLEAFGKNKRGAYEGSCMHDDLATTVLFTSIAFEQESFIHWCEDWLNDIRYRNNISDEMKRKIRTVDYYLDNYPTQTIEEDNTTEEEILSLYKVSSSGFNDSYNTYNNDASYSGFGNVDNNHYLQSRMNGSGFGTMNTGYGSFNRQYNNIQPMNPFHNR